MRELDPPHYRIVGDCNCPKGTLHVVVDGDGVRIDWIFGPNRLRDVRNCLRCSKPLHIEHAGLPNAS